MDFIQAVPYFSIIKFLEKINQNNSVGCKFIEHRAINPKIYVILLIKIIKVYKMFYNNNNISYFSEILSRNEIIDDHGGVIIIFFITLLVLNMTTSIFIFLGINIYPGWIIKLNIQDKGYLYIYLVIALFYNCYRYNSWIWRYHWRRLYRNNIPNMLTYYRHYCIFFYHQLYFKFYNKIK